MTNTIYHGPEEHGIAELVAETLLIRTVEDALQLFMDLAYQGADKIILHEHQLTPGFFKLSTRLAGDILQKCSNYKIRLAIIGSFGQYQSQSLEDFIRESNRGRTVCFVPTVEEALEWFRR